jgi:hypothetical protein
MPIIKQNKELDNSENSIYRASRKLAKRQIKNMKAPVEEEGTTPSVAPVSVDREGLVSQLLQNLNDVNGLMSSLKLLGSGGDDADEPRSTRPFPRKRLRGGAGRYKDKIDELQSKIEKKKIELRELADEKERLKRSPSTPNNNRLDDVKRLITNAKKYIVEANKRITLLEAKGDDEDEPLKPSPPPPQLKEDKGDRNKFDRLMETLINELGNAQDRGADLEDDPDLHGLLQELNRLSTRLNNEPKVNVDYRDYSVIRGDNKLYPKKPKKKEYETDDEAAFQDTQEVPDNIFEDDDGKAPLPPPPPPPPRIDEIPPPDDDFDFSTVDFSRVRKSALLVILGQLKSMIKRGELLLKRIKQMGIIASESELEQIIQDVADIMSSKRYIINHSGEIGDRRGEEVKTYLEDILNNQIGKYISSLKTYVKQYAQMSRSQSRSIQEEVPDEDIEDIAGAGRRLSPDSVGKKGYNPVIISDAVRRIKQYDRKYLL